MTSYDLPEPTAQHRAREAHLLDECRAAEAAWYGKRVELCMHAGLRDQADHWRKEMEKVVRARHAAALDSFEHQGLDFFTASAAADSAVRVEVPEHA